MASIYLIGPMGAGKSTVGRALAKKLDYDFYDSDREIEDRCGVDIPTIFDYEGEVGFRDRESRVLEELTTLPDVVIATGGGSILRDENREYLKRGYVVLLSVDIKEQLRRVAHDTQRPLLQGDNPEKKLHDLMKARGPIYAAAADVEIATDARRMHYVVARIMKHLRSKNIIQ
ncbi:MAG: shikimate kinase [Granulosicoccus sp.]|nr:shikimate kinase [Granulosicoccus sp.]